MSDTDGISKQRMLWQTEQERLKNLLVLCDDFAPRTNCDGSGSQACLRFIGGVDVSFDKKDSELACGALVVIDMDTMNVVYEDFKIVHLTLPYIPGFLAFRESPVLLELIQKLMKEHPEVAPDVIMVDGNGILHPRGFGLASHIGVLANIPTIGVAKNLHHVDGLSRAHINTILKIDELNDDTTNHDGCVSKECLNTNLRTKSVGFNYDRSDDATHHIDGISKEQLNANKIREVMTCDVTPLTGDSGQVLGMALRSHKGCTKPIFISIGHRISLGTAVGLVQKCGKYRIPEPIRQADIRSRERMRLNFSK